MLTPYTRSLNTKPHEGARLALEIAAGTFAVRHHKRFPVWLRRILAERKLPRNVRYDLMFAWVKDGAPELMERQGA